MNAAARPIILNVDDNAAGRYATSRILQQAGFEVWEAASGAETLKKALQGPDLVLLDVNLPDFNGFEVCRRLKESPVTRNLPVVHLSATCVEAHDRATGLDGGADGYLVQPVESRELIAAVRALLRLRETEKQLRASEARFRTMLYSIGEAVIATDIAGRVELLNPVAETLTGWRLEEAVGRPLTDVFRVLHEDTRRSIEDPVTQVLGTGGVVGLSNHTLLIGKDGNERPIADAAAPIRDDQGTITGVVLVFRDQSAERTAERALQQKVRERETLLKEIHHRVKNNLQVISSLLNLQARRSQNLLVAEALLITQTRVRSMAMLHESLYRSQDLARIDFKNYVEKLCGTLGYTLGVDPDRISLQMRVSDVELPLEQAMPCGLIINELVTNVLKHAFPAGRRGSALVTLETAADQMLVLTVADDGVGLPDTLDIHQTATLGLEVVRSLVAQLQGTLSVDRAAPGVRFRISFPAT